MIAFDAWGAITTLATIVALAVIVAGLLQNAIQIAQLALAARALAARAVVNEPSAAWRRYADSAPPIALLAPAFNEELSIVDSVRSLLALHYPDFEVIVINDGSTDATLARLIDAFELRPVARHFESAAQSQPIRGLWASERQPRLLIADKVNGGKADALNAGLNLARSPIVCAMDADSLLEPEALLKAVRPFVEDPARVVAVGGSIRIVNGCEVDFGRVLRVRAPKNIWALFQTVEYLRAFLLGRLAWSRLGALTIISGAFGLFRRDMALAVGGYSRDTVGEDMELVMKLHRHCLEARRPYRIVFEAEPVCWTEAPETHAGLARQRARWQRGALETFARHEDMLFNPRYGAIGLIGMGHMLLVDVLGPVTEVMGYLLLPLFAALGLLSYDYFKAFLCLSVGFGVAVSVGALALEESKLRRFPAVSDLLLLLAAAVAENFGYRQLSNVWRLWGTWQHLRKRQGWGVIARRGFRPAAAG